VSESRNDPADYFMIFAFSKADLLYREKSGVGLNQQPSAVRSKKQSTTFNT
jgi:hypothetical protein